MFDHLLGNEPLKAYLQRAITENRLPQTLLFAGPDGIGKSLFAKAVARSILGADRSPDLHILSPEGKSGLYGIDTLREMIDKEHAAPFEAQRKVFILEEAERMQPASANALLKTLEEPTPETVFILLSSAPQQMLPTILSRCVLLTFQPLAEKAIASLLERQNLPIQWAKLAHGSVARAFELARQPEFVEQKKIAHQILTQKPSYPELCQQVDKLEKLLEEGKEDNPLQYNRRVEHLFAYVLMWHRDQMVKEIGGKEEWLFFPENREFAKGKKPLKEVEKAIEKARQAHHLHLKLSVCLNMLFSALTL